MAAAPAPITFVPKWTKQGPCTNYCLQCESTDPENLNQCGTCSKFYCPTCSCSCNDLPDVTTLAAAAGRILVTNSQSFPWSSGNPITIEDEFGWLMHITGDYSSLFPGVELVLETPLEGYFLQEWQKSAYNQAQQSIWNDEIDSTEVRINGFAVRIFGFEIGLDKFTVSFFSPV